MNKTGKGVMVLVSAVICFSVLLGVVACSSQDSNPLLGKWIYASGENIANFDDLEFLKDGTVIVNGRGEKYRILDKERVEITHYKNPQIMEYKITGDELVVNWKQAGKPMKFARKK